MNSQPESLSRQIEDRECGCHLGGRTYEIVSEGSIKLGVRQD